MKSFKLFFSLVLSLSLSSFSYAQSSLDLKVDDVFPQRQINQALDVSVNIDFALDFEVSGPVNSDVSQIALIYQKGNSNIAEINQEGLLNKAIISQIGSQNEAFQYQYGISNLALISQEGITNFAEQKQWGNYNQAYILQDGSNNQAFQYQYTDYNTAIIVQMGSNNQAYQYQGVAGGSGYRSTIVQQGNGNSAIIYQY